METTDEAGRRASQLALWEAKNQAHKALDRLWKNVWERDEAYAWLRGKMKMGEEECHIANFNIEQCKEVVRLVRERTRK